MAVLTVTNFNPTAINDDGSCEYCNLSNQITVTIPSDSSSCDGVIIVNTTSTYPITSYSISDFQGNILSSNNFAFGLCNGVYLFLLLIVADVLLLTLLFWVLLVVA